MQARRARKAPDAKKSGIKPYDASPAEDRFRKDFIDRLASKESEVRELSEQNDELSRSLSQRRDELEERRIRVDERTIALISFQTVINCWSRFLDLRQTNARQNLADPLDDIDCLEAAVHAMDQRARPRFPVRAIGVAHPRGPGAGGGRVSAASRPRELSAARERARPAAFCAESASIRIRGSELGG
jgi:hypothetical protein